MGRVIQPVTNVSLQMNPPPIPDLDGVTTAPYGNRGNFRLAILLITIHNIVYPVSVWVWLVGAKSSHPTISNNIISLRIITVSL